MDHLQAGQEFLADNAQQPDVHVTDSGLQYAILRPGDGPTPGPDATVEVNYHGTFIDNRVFDTTYTGLPVTLDLDQVIAGMAEGLQLMPQGATYKFYIPPGLAYGADGVPGSVPPHAVLVFEVELIEVVPTG